MPIFRPSARRVRDGLGDQRLHGRVALVEDVGDDLGVAIDAERELRQVVRADREAVEDLGELLGAESRCSGFRTIM